MDLPAWERPSGLAYFDNARRGGLARGTFVVKRVDGSQLHVEASSSTLKLGGEQFVVTFVRDMSEPLRQTSAAAALAQAAASVAVCDSIDTTVQALAECVLQVTRALGAWVSLHDEEDVATWVGVAGLPDGAREGIRHADRATASHASFMHDLLAHRVVVSPEARQQAESGPGTARLAEALKPLPWRTAALAPLIFGGGIAGLLTAIYREDELPSEAETTFLATPAEQGAIAAANARLVAAAQQRILSGNASAWRASCSKTTRPERSARSNTSSSSQKQARRRCGP